MDILIRIACLCIGYVFGLFQTAYIYGKLNGFDLKNSGSGNYGTTNMMRTKGAKAGFLVLFGDAFKCVFAVLAVWLIFGKGQYADLFPLLKLYAAAGAILGHNFPFYMGFKGGKGIAATAGLFIVLGFEYAIPELILFALVFVTTHYVSLGSLLMYVLLIAETIVLGQMGYAGFVRYDLLSQKQLIELYVIMVLLAIMAFAKHHENIKRLMSGTERKTYIKKKGEES